VMNPFHRIFPLTHITSISTCQMLRPDPMTLYDPLGFLANRSKKKDLGRCRELLGLSPELPQPSKKTTHELMLELTGIDVTKCPFCKKGTMKVVTRLAKFSDTSLNTLFNQPQIKDSS
jgi:hypothetical protein